MNKLGAMTTIFSHIIFDICFCVVETQSCNTPGLFLLLILTPRRVGVFFFLINLWENKASMRIWNEPTHREHTLSLAP